VSRLTTAVGIALIGISLLCARALADADPASDILLGANVFYPYNPPVSNRLQKTLNAETIAAAKAHLAIKVALIDSPTDLGAIPNFFDKPQTYADFLDQEISFVAPHAALLVVMPNGYGIRRFPAAAAAAAASLPKPSGPRSNDLVQAAILAVQKLAAAAGHPLGQISERSGGSSNSTSAPTIGIVAFAAVAISGAVLATRRRLSRQR
jgi:hypothetical protein